MPHHHYLQQLYELADLRERIEGCSEHPPSGLITPPEDVRVTMVLTPYDERTSEECDTAWAIIIARYAKIDHYE